MDSTSWNLFVQNPLYDDPEQEPPAEPLRKSLHCVVCVLIARLVLGSGTNHEGRAN